MYRRLIPNACTSSNLLFGMCSILSTLHGNLFWGAGFILIALVADGLDGRTARYFGVTSELGKEMDSLCDLGSFGIAPAFLAYVFCLDSYGYMGWAVAIFFALCGMWRLARFNVNTDVVHGYFMGLAIPAGGCIVATTTLLFTALGIRPEDYGLVYQSACSFDVSGDSVFRQGGALAGAAGSRVLDLCPVWHREFPVCADIAE